MGENSQRRNAVRCLEVPMPELAVIDKETCVEESKEFGELWFFDACKLR